MSTDWSQLPARLTFRQARSLLGAYEWNEQRFMDQCTIPASAYFEWRASVVLKRLRDGKPADRVAALKDLAVLAAGYGPDDPPKAAIAAAGGIETLVAVLGADQAELHVSSLLILSKLSRHDYVRLQMLRSSALCELLTVLASKHQERTVGQLAAMTLANVIRSDESPTSLATLQTGSVVEAALNGLHSTMDGRTWGGITFGPVAFLIVLAHLAVQETNKLPIATSGAIMLIERILDSAGWDLGTAHQARGTTESDASSACVHALTILRQLSFDAGSRSILRTRLALRRAITRLASSRSRELSSSAASLALQLGLDESLAITTADGQVVAGRITVLISACTAHELVLAQRIGRSLEVQCGLTSVEVHEAGENSHAAVARCSVLLMILSRSYKDSASCRLDAEAAFGARKAVVGLLAEEGWVPDGWTMLLLASSPPLLTLPSATGSLDDFAPEIHRAISEARRAIAEADMLYAMRGLPHERQLSSVARATAEANNIGDGIDGIESQLTDSALTQLITGQPRGAALGIHSYMRVDDTTVYAGMAQGVSAIQAEFDAYGTDEDRECLAYVRFERAGSSSLTFPNGLRDKERHGETLADFVDHESSQRARLSEAHVAALRVYTTAAYKSLNAPLRRTAPNEPYRFPVTLAFLADGIKRLRAVEADRGGDGCDDRIDLFRGIRDRFVTVDFLRYGGTEIAPMSTTSDLAVALRYCRSRAPLLLKIRTSSFMERGADLSFLSAFPGEAEMLYPPLTYLRPTGKRSDLEIGPCRFSVVEVVPSIGT
jgi:hypothetical protein